MATERPFAEMTLSVTRYASATMPVTPGCETVNARRVVVALATVRTNTRVQASTAASQSSGSGAPSSVVASDRKATRVPSSLMLGERAARSPCVPLVATLIRVVVEVWTSRRKTSRSWLVSPATRLAATDSNTT